MQKKHIMSLVLLAGSTYAFAGEAVEQPGQSGAVAQSPQLLSNHQSQASDEESFSNYSEWLEARNKFVNKQSEVRACVQGIQEADATWIAYWTSGSYKQDATTRQQKAAELEAEMIKATTALDSAQREAQQAFEAKHPKTQYEKEFDKGLE